MCNLLLYNHSSNKKTDAIVVFNHFYLLNIGIYTSANCIESSYMYTHVFIFYIILYDLFETKSGK